MRSDPNYAAVAADLSKASAAVDGLSSTINAASKSASASATAASNAAYAASGLAPELKLLENGTAQLVAGIKALHSGNAQLASGISQLSGGGGQLSSGLTQLTAGAGALQSGLGQLTNGTGQLYSGLAGGVGPAGQLATGLGTMKRAVVKSRGQIPSTRDLKTLEKQSPGIFNSGYFVLAAVEGATASQRNAATFTINLTNGGTAGQVVVISKYPAGDPRNQALAKRLAALGAVFATRNNVQVAVGGVGGNLHDLTSVTKSRIPLAITVLALAMWLVLALALRAVLLPAVATLFSLLVAAATFGVLKLLFGGSNPLLGGPGHLDPMTLIGIFTLAFSISIAYAAVLTMRTREALLADGDSEEAVRIGLRQTAAALTGAGIVMIAALIPFITTDMINIRQFGIGVAVAILLNVVIARPVLLPAAEAVLGRSGWWPTTVPGRTGPPAEAGSKGRAPRRAPQAHLPHRRPRTADR
jgi:X-X-X-Leu-X-X-Gly heptad repeat protein